MKETIYTIPVMDAFREPCECAFCQMYETLEHNAINFLLGPSTSYMEGDIREKTNEAGFCRHHYSLMYAVSNRLGVALIAQTHFAKLRKETEAVLRGTPKSKPKRALLGAHAASPISVFMKKREKSCYLCGMIDSTFEKYVDTFFMLWLKEEELRALVQKGNGFCLPHFAMMTDAAVRLGTADYREFIALANEVQLKNLERVQTDLDWFVRKFDYRFREEPWHNAKNAVRRTIQKLSSEVIHESNDDVKTQSSDD